MLDLGTGSKKKSQNGSYRNHCIFIHVAHNAQEKKPFEIEFLRVSGGSIYKMSALPRDKMKATAATRLHLLETELFLEFQWGLIYSKHGLANRYGIRADVEK